MPWLVNVCKLRIPIQVLDLRMIFGRHVKLPASSMGDCLQAEAKAGGQFEMFGGSVVGKYVSVKQNQEIILDWRFRNWQESDVSKVRLKIWQWQGQRAKEEHIEMVTPSRHVSRKSDLHLCRASQIQCT